MGIVLASIQKMKSYTNPPLFSLCLVILALFTIPPPANTDLAYAKINGTCVTDSRYDGDFKENYYCGPLTSWNITKDDFYSQTNHRVALQRYQELYREWMEKSSKDGKEDCLGIGWFFFCATAIPYCDVEEQKVYSGITCTSACDLFKYRCPNETRIYNLYCG